MWKWGRVVSSLSLVALCACGSAGCAAKSAKSASGVTAADAEETPMPTVPPAAPTPAADASATGGPKALPTRPIPTGVKGKKGEPIGPIITHFGAARADGTPVPPESIGKDGIPVYVTRSGSGFILVIEGKTGLAGHEVGRRLFVHVPGDPSERADMELESNRDLGNGSAAVCDRMRPNIGGIPGINPPSFASTQKISDAINDFACRFETFVESDFSCTMTKSGDYQFVNPETTTQFCLLMAKAWGFPEGDTILSLRLRDTAGNAGPVKKLRIRHTAQPVPPKAAK